MPQPEGVELDAVRARREELRTTYRSAENFAAAKRKLDAAGVEYLGPDRGVEVSLYVRDPNGIGLEFYREELGVFDGEPLLDD